MKTATMTCLLVLLGLRRGAEIERSLVYTTVDVDIKK
jgi:hypothetical protein